MSHKKRDWSKYNKSLVNRGSLTFWIDPKVLKKWKSERQKGKLGRPFKYSDTLINLAATVRYTFKLSLRSCEGFLKSILKMLKLPAKVPSYTQICRRMQKLSLSPHLLQGRSIRHVVLDATGLKVFGEGEWKVKRHGACVRRQWRKLHLAVDEHTQEILFADITSEYEPDTKFIPEIISTRKRVKRVMIDGAADDFSLHKLLWENEIDFLTPPPKNARVRKEPWLDFRNRSLLQILGLGGDKTARSLWGKLTGYSKRATVESAIARWKKLYSGHLQSRNFANQRVEVILKSEIMNKMKELAGSSC